MATLPPAASSSPQRPGLEEEDLSLDEYDLYSLAHSYLGRTWLCHLSGPFTSDPLPHKLLLRFPGAGGRKGRTKREAAANTNRPSPGGHERKLVTKLRNTEQKKRGARP
ncbi:Nuclear protein 1 [Galemys pyrenaicus]|uniref:Nuclear protein 1 n=1 Tax=Galemys pyrenaicus TaxID=202257 RepID=A0A8J6A8E3_GALPY|nr:Nuclear protein 1 [Galemys pyrenaicus]